MKLNVNKLRGKIVEKYGTCGEFAKAIGVSRNTVSYKLNDRVMITLPDLVEWSDKLGITASEIGDYFYDVEEE